MKFLQKPTKKFIKHSRAKDVLVLSNTNTSSFTASYFVTRLKGGGGAGFADTTCTSNINTWLGLSPKWGLASNWSAGQVPTVCGSVVINSGVPFMLEISTPNAACYGLTLNSGATIIICTSGHLTIIGP